MIRKMVLATALAIGASLVGVAAHAQTVWTIPFWIPQAGVAAGIVVFAFALVDELVWLLEGAKPRYEALDEVDIDKPVA